jgi:hypothetical protein
VKDVLVGICCLLQFLEDGVDYLMRMLKVQTPILEERKEVATNDEAVFQLLQKGEIYYLQKVCLAVLIVQGSLI